MTALANALLTVLILAGFVLAVWLGSGVQPW